MVLVFGGLIQVFADLGFAHSLIQYKAITEADRSTAFWTNTMVGMMLTAVGIASAPLVAGFFGEPAIQPLLIVLSLSFTFAALGSTQASLLYRQMRFRELEVAASVASLLGSTIAIVLAFLGAGPWALILQAMTIAITTTVLLWVFARWRPHLIFSRASLKKLWGFGASVFGSRMFGYLSRDTDNLLVGRFLGAHALGVNYSMSYAVIAMQVVRPAACSDLIPLVSDVRQTPGRRDADAGGLAPLALAMCVAMIAPLSLGVAAVAHDFIAVVLGDRWLPAATSCRCSRVSHVSVFSPMNALTTSVLAAQFRTKLLLKVSTGAFLVHLAGFVIGLHWGVIGVALGYAIRTHLWPCRFRSSLRREFSGPRLATLSAHSAASCRQPLEWWFSSSGPASYSSPRGSAHPFGCRWSSRSAPSRTPRS